MMMMMMMMILNLKGFFGGGIQSQNLFEKIFCGPFWGHNFYSIHFLATNGAPQVLESAGSPVEMAMAAVPAAVLVTPDAAMAADGVPSVVLGVTWAKRAKSERGNGWRQPDAWYWNCMKLHNTKGSYLKTEKMRTVHDVLGVIACFMIPAPCYSWPTSLKTGVIGATWRCQSPWIMLNSSSSSSPVWRLQDPNFLIQRHWQNN